MKPLILLAFFSGCAGLLFGQSAHDAVAQAQTPESVPRKTVLEVIEKVCTRGTKVRSFELRVFSDGTAEGHYLRTLRWYESVEKKKISAHEYEALRAILENRDLPQLRYRYERMYPVLDSWIEWDIIAKHPSGDQTIEVSGFSPSSARESKQPYPDVLTKLGCSILKLRRELYGDSAGSRLADENEECRHALEDP